MAHKTFISYKFSEAQDLRDNILKLSETTHHIIRVKQVILLT